MPRIIWGTLAAAAVTAALAGCGSTSNAGSASSEVSGSATPTSTTATGTQGSASPGNGSPSTGSPNTGTGDGDGSGTRTGGESGNGNGAGTGTRNGTGNGGGNGNGSGNGTSGENETGSGSGAGWSRCTSDVLSASVTEPDGAVGNRYAFLVLTNNSGKPCLLRGWSGLQLANASGPVPTQVVREGSPYAILVPSGYHAYERLHWTVVHTGDETGNPCQPVATVLKVTPPHTTEQITAPWAYGPVCGHGEIRVTPVTLSPNPPQS